MPTFIISALANALIKFLTNNPKIDIKITEAYSSALEKIVRSNKLKFAIVPLVKNLIDLNLEFISIEISLVVTFKNFNLDHLIKLTTK